MTGALARNVGHGRELPMESLDKRRSQLNEVMRPLADVERYFCGAARRQEIEGAITTVRRFIEAGDLEKLIAAFEDTQRPATQDEIGLALASLVAAFPNAPKANLEAFGALLARDVASKNPSIYALETACRKLRQTQKWIPTIAEVLEAIEFASLSLDGALRTLRRVPRSVADAEKALASQEQSRWDAPARLISK